MTTVLHLITSLRTGGAERMLEKLVTRDRSVRHIVVAMAGTDPIGPRMAAAGIELIDLGMTLGRPSVMALLRLVRILRAKRPDIVQTWLYHADLLGLVGARLAGVPRLIWTLRCSNIDFSQYNVLTGRIVRLLARLSGIPDLVLANSQVGMAAHMGLGYRPRAQAVVPNGFDTELFRPDVTAAARLRATLGLDAGARVIGMAARFDPQKDHATLLDAMALVATTHHSARLVLLGRGCDAAGELFGMVQARGLADRVVLAGERADMDRILPGLEVACLSSAFGEGFPNFLGEAMACGIACIATDVGDARDIVGAAGLIVPPRDAPALAAALSSLLDDPARLGVLGVQARQRIIEHFSIESVVARFSEHYHALMKSGRH